MPASYRAIESIIEMINNSDDLDFVCFGSNGYRAQLENKTFFGSTADELLKKAKANILIIPWDFYNKYIFCVFIDFYYYILSNLFINNLN